MTKNTRLAFVYPGQGSQSAGMLSDLVKNFSIAGQTFEEASDVLGYDLWSLIENGPVQDLNRTEKTQPAMLTAGVATWRVWQEKNGAKAAFLAGHSMGEYTALVCAGSIEFPAAVALVADRGKIMQEAVPDGIGAMAAILGLEDMDVIRLCETAAGTEIVSAANFNSPGQIVIAGHHEAVGRVVISAKEAGAKRSVILPVSVPSHCVLMTEAAQRFSARLLSISVADANIPVIQNVDASPHTASKDILPILLAQLYKPVRWTDTIHTMIKLGVGSIIECGPGRILCGLNKRIDPGLQCMPVFDTTSLHKALGYFEEKV